MTARWITADVFDGLATLETGSVDLVVSSPPFLALRSYLPADHPDKHKEIGSEATPAEFIDVLLRVTAELRRVLAPHGSICVELGDTYSGSGESGWERDKGPYRSENRSAASAAGLLQQTRDLSTGWPLSKSRTLIPQLYEIALAYGVNPLTGTPSPAGQWRIRNVVTWARPNPPVGALGDKWRPATSDLIVACVSPKRYWDDLATRRPLKPGTLERGSTTRPEDGKGGSEGRGGGWSTLGAMDYRQGDPNGSGAPLLDYWEIPLLEGEEPKQYGPGHKESKNRKVRGNEKRQSADYNGDPKRLKDWDASMSDVGAPLLDYWEIPPGGYKGSHYAVFPEELVVPCVKAMCPEKVCRVCGEPSRRIVSDPEYVGAKSGLPYKPHVWASGQGDGKAAHSHKKPDEGARRMATTLGWTSCGHDDYRPGLVLDPFAGSGTTLSVATGHGHDAIGIDLDPRNADLARDRIGPFLFEETRMQ